MHRGTDFLLYRNDLIPFFDNDTFPIKYGFDIPFLQQHALGQARLLDVATVIRVCSATSRTVTVEFKYLPRSQSREIQLSGQAGQAIGSIKFGEEGTVKTPAIGLLPGENQIQLKPTPGGDRIEVLEMKIVEAGSS